MMTRANHRSTQLMLVLVAGLFLAARPGFGFPEMVRHGYINCTTCHVSPNGGGTLTKYGRSLSEEVLSTWHYEGEGQFAYGIIPTPDWLMGGGDFRALQLYTDTPMARDARWIWMQNDLEAAATWKKFTVDASLGYFDTTGSFLDHVISRRHFLMYQPTESIALRGGRFMRAFGINTPDHVIYTKQPLGMDEGMETYNVEASYITEKFDAFATAIFGRPDSSTLSPTAEKGFALRSSMAIDDSYKVGLSYSHTYNDRQLSRDIGGPYGILGFTKRFFVLAEGDLQNLAITTNSVKKFGLASYLRADYEFIQGIHVYLTHEFLEQQFGDGVGTSAYGAGFQFFPRPHFEISGFAKHFVTPGSDPTEELALLLHFYP